MPRTREVQGTVTLPHGKEKSPKVKRVNSAKTNYRHPLTGQIVQRPSSQPAGGLLNSKTVDMNFAFWGFRKKPKSAGPGGREEAEASSRDDERAESRSPEFQGGHDREAPLGVRVAPLPARHVRRLQHEPSPRKDQGVAGANVRL